MSELIDIKDAGLPAGYLDALGGADINDELSAGISGGFSVLSIRGSKWRVKAGGEEEVLTDNEGEMVPSVRVVLLKANKHISKNYYAEGFTEGSADAPDCFSVDGFKPDPSVENPINDKCANCPMNQFGSRVTDTGSKAKACADNKRIALVPEGDLKNEKYNGPMLLRIPAASLSTLATYAKGMKAKGYPYNAVVTRLSFDPDTAYPKLKFQAMRPLNGEEAKELMELHGETEFIEKINYILAEPIESVTEKPADKQPDAIEDMTSFADDSAKEPEPEKPQKPKAKAKAKKEPEPEPAPAKEETSGGLDMDIDDLLSKLE